MMKSYLQLTCLWAVLFSTPLCAQQRATLSLKQAWDQAFQTYPGLTEREALLGQSQIYKQEIKSHSLPQLQLQAQNSYGTFEGSSGAFFPVPGVFNVTGTPSAFGNEAKATGNTFGSVLLDWKFFEFGKQRKTIEAAEYQVQGAKSSYDAARLSLKVKVSRLYFEILYSSSSLIWAKQNTKRVKEILDLSISLTQAGLKPGADTLLAASSYSQALANEYDWRGKYNASKVNFSEVVPFGDFDLPQQVFSHYSTSTHPAIPVSQSHPYLQVLDKQVLSEKAQESAISRKVFPSFSLLGGVSSRGSGINPDGTLQNGLIPGHNYANNYLVGIGLSWNIHMAYTSTLEKKRMQKTIEASIAKYSLQKLQMTTTLNAVSERIIQQQELVRQNNRAFHQAEEAYNLYFSRYESGLINLTELLQIQFFLQKAERESIEAIQVLWNLLITQSETSGDFDDLLTQFN